MKNNKPVFKLWEVILITLIGSLIMGLTTGYVVYTSKKEQKCFINTKDKNLNTFLNVYNSILSNYYGDINQEKIIESAINGLMNYLDDPYTTYLNEDSKELLLDSLKGTYEGIGVLISQEEETKAIKIVEVYEDTPASIAGIMAGDIIKSINDISLEDKTNVDAVNIIRQSKDGNVKIEVDRVNQSIKFDLKISLLNVPVVVSEIFEKNNKKIGYINLAKFSATASEQFSEELSKLEEQNIDSLIIDVRNNTGGYLNVATHILELFLDEKEVIYSLKNKLKTISYKDETKEHRTYKIMVITNSSSASASEVLAGALKHSYGATIIGEKSFGKGKVQQTSKLEDGTMIKYTSAEWLMPNGKGIDGVGIIPDIEVILSEEYIKNRTQETDNQLQSAIYELSK